MVNYCLAATSILLVVMAGSASAYDYCQEGAERMAVLIDQTTIYDAADREVIIGGMERIIQKLPAGTLLTVHTISDAAANSRTIFTGCRPGCRERGWTGWFVSACSPIRAKKEDQVFFTELAGKLGPVLGTNTSFPKSDIVRTIRAASHKVSGRGVSKMIVYSDLLENSDLIPYRKKNYFGDTIAAKRKIESLGMLSNLSNSTVIVFGFGRSHNNTEFGNDSSGRDGLDVELEARVLEFWQWYLRSSGAKSTSISRQYSE